MKILRDFLLAQCRGVFLTLKTGRRRDQYCIKHNYFSRIVNEHFDARKSTDEFQDKIYRAIRVFCERESLRSVIDIGCGSGFKLMKYFSDLRTLGTEVEPALSFLRAKYPSREWVHSDFKNTPKGKYDIAICVDVIEHLLDPDMLLDFLSNIQCRYIAISTPERDELARIRSRIGPPLNKHHVREWNQREFVQYVNGRFRIVETGVVSRTEQYVIGVNDEWS